MVQWLWLCFAACFLTACTVERAAPILKIGLLAPFEGEQRELGYRLLPALRAATPATLRGHHVEWVILDTHGDALVAAQRARELLVDPDVVAIVGPLLPEEVEAVGAVLQSESIAWWPLAPSGAEGLRTWHRSIPNIPPEQAWGPSAWPALMRGQIDSYLAPRLPSDLREFPGETPWPQDWLAWRATELAFEAITAAPTLNRAAIRAASTPLDIPPPALYQSKAGVFPGTIIDP
ncbi:MAG: ABC transporter substrate-binding protein [Ardenticatenales bacterium]|nr:ABC transporter substrate-binding protein [Ardenticatenales bacterium]